jgi:ABC-2 type transport system permease protein
MFERILLPGVSLWRREMVRFFRQRSRVTGSLATPVLFWLFFSAGYGPSFRSDAAGAAAGSGSSFVYFLPGTLALIILFTSIFSNISIIEDRREGFLQGVLAAPVSRLAIVLGKVLGGSTIALLQGLVFLLLAVVTGIDVHLHAGAAGAAILLLAISTTALGFLFAWRMDTVQAFHGIMNLVLMPLWLLSGALFPAQGTPAALRILILANPVTYGLAALRHSLGVPAPDVAGAGLAWAVSIAFAGATLGGAVLVALRPESGARVRSPGRPR